MYTAGIPSRLYHVAVPRIQGGVSAGSRGSTGGPEGEKSMPRQTGAARLGAGTAPLPGTGASPAVPGQRFRSARRRCLVRATMRGQERRSAGASSVQPR